MRDDAVYPSSHMMFFIKILNFCIFRSKDSGHRHLSLNNAMQGGPHRKSHVRLERPALLNYLVSVVRMKLVIKLSCPLEGMARGVKITVTGTIVSTAIHADLIAIRPLISKNG